MAGELILVVEDDPRSRKLVVDVLVVKGYQVQEAASAEAGLQHLVNDRPALILMDIQLPGIDGVEALRRIRENPVTRAIPVIAVTASVMTTQTRTLLDAGFNDLERKPVSVASLLAKVRQCIETAANTRT